MDTRRTLFLGVLTLALIHSTLYLFIVPPWDHYDEPTHFEHGWLIADRLRLPKAREVDPVLRREVAASMLEHGFQREHAIQPALLPGEGTPPKIGVSELAHPPVYYILIALPLRLVRYADVQTQLYVARGVSLLLYLVVVACAWGVGEAITHTGTEGTQRDTQKTESLELVVPFFLSLVVALLPGVADMMTAVNSDAGAIAAFSVFLWCGVRAIRRRTEGHPAGWSLAGCALAAGLCPLVKNTAAVALVLLPLVCLLALAPPLRRRRSGWAHARLLVAVLLTAAVGFGIVFFWGNAALWHRIGAQTTPTRQKAPQAPLGETALVLEQQTGHLGQFLSEHDLETVRGKTVSLGAWIWSPQTIEVTAPMLQDGRSDGPVRPQIQVGSEPAYYSFTRTVSAQAPYLYIQLYSAPPRKAPDQPVYYDGVALAEGDRTTAPGSGPGSGSSQVPQFDSPNGTAGTWAGRRFENLARNGSAQRAAPSVRPLIDQLVSRYTRRAPSLWLDSLLDWRRSAGLYPIVARQLLQTFWARFSWNHIPLPEAWYWVLGAVSLFCVVGAAVGVWRRMRAFTGEAETRQQDASATRRVLLLLGLAGALIWVNAVLRFHPIGTRIFIPVARYAYPAIVPTALVLVGGSWALTRKRLRWLRVSLFCGEVVLAGVSLWTVIGFHRYRPQTPARTAVGLAFLALCVPAGLLWERIVALARARGLARRAPAFARRASAFARRASALARRVRQALPGWWKNLGRGRRLVSTAVAGVTILVAVGALVFGGPMLVRPKRSVSPQRQAIDELNALAHELKLSQATVGIADELCFADEDLRLIGGELLYRQRPLAELVCHPGSHDLLVLPNGDGIPLVEQAVALWGDVAPHSGRPSGILVVALPAESATPEECAAVPHSALSLAVSEEKQPSPMKLLDWEAPIPDRHRLASVLPHPWQASPPCPEETPLLIVEERAADYARLQSRGEKIQLALRARVQTAPCKLMPGDYRFTWRVFATHSGPEHTQLQVSVWEHPADYPPRLVYRRMVHTSGAWATYDERFGVTRGMPVSLEIRWLDGPGYPDIDDGQPKTAITLDSKVHLRAETVP